MTTIEQFTAGEAMSLAGCNYTFLNNLARAGLLAPSIQPAAGKGSARLYSFGDVLALRVVRQMREAGLELQALAAWIEALRSPALLAGLEAEPGEYQYLLSRGAEIRPVSLKALRSAFGAPEPISLTLVLNLQAIVAELRATITVMKWAKSGV